MMMGRRGLDPLSLALMALSLIISFFTRFSDLFLIRLIPAVLLGWVLYRVLSKNIASRERENNFFLGFFGPLFNRGRSAAQGTVNKIKQGKDYRFYRCPGCSQQLRVPRGRGKLEIVCPRCKATFTKKT